MPQGIKHVPTKATRDLVMLLVGFGIEQQHIAGRLGISTKTLSRIYRKELDRGAADMIGNIAGSLYKRSMDPKGGMASAASAMFMLKCRAHWRESQIIEHTGANGAPMLPSQGDTVNIYRVNLPDNGRDPLPDIKLIEGRAQPEMSIDRGLNDQIRVETNPGAKTDP